MKKIIWIDDDVEKMQEIISGIIRDLWGDDSVQEDNRFRSEILIWGNAFEDEYVVRKSDLSIENLNDIILDCYMDLSYECGKEDYFGKHIKLVSNEKKDPCDIATADVAKRIETEQDNTILDFWNDESKLSPDNIDKMEKMVEPLINALKEKGLDQAEWVGIDMILLKDEFKRLLKGEQKPVISIVLFHQLYQLLNGHCFFYTTYKNVENLITNFKSTYKAIYGENVSIVYRKHLSNSEKHFEEFQQLRNRIVKSSNEEKGET